MKLLVIGLRRGSIRLARQVLLRCRGSVSDRIISCDPRLFVGKGLRCYGVFVFVVNMMFLLAEVLVKSVLLVGKELSKKEIEKASVTVSIQSTGP